MKYCARCLYPANHPLNITFDSTGVCSGCRIHEEKDLLDWTERAQRLEKILEGYKHKSGSNYDCIIPVVGGRDSYFIVHTIKNVYKLNPLLVTFNHEYNTRIGIRNLANLVTKFDCDHMMSTVAPVTIKKLVRKSLRERGSIYWHFLAGMQTFPVQIAVRFKIPLIIWGVHGWSDQVGMFSHSDEVEMTKKVRNEHSLMGLDANDMVSKEDGITLSDVEPFFYPADYELAGVGVRGLYLSNYIRWDSKRQHENMIRLYGYETNQQQRTFNTYEDVDCLHSAGVQDYLKFLKYGYGKVTDHACREIRLKRMTREEGIGLVEFYSEKIPDDLEIFLNWSGITKAEFYKCADQFRDPRIWDHRSDGKWHLNDSIINHSQGVLVDNARLEKIEECMFSITPHREPTPEDRQILMGRNYLNKYNYYAVDDTPVLPEPDHAVL